MSMALNLTTRSLKLSNPQSHLIYKYRYRLTSSNSFTITSALKTSKDKAESKSISAKIVVSDRAPSLADSKGDTGNGVAPEKERPSKAGKLGFVKRYSKKLLSILSNLPLAIGEMFAIAALMALGTFIDQGESPEYYLQTYPDNSPVLGIFTYRLILALGFDHMFSSPIFLGTLILLGTSLIACTYTTQIPTVKVARRWSFLQSSEKIRKLDFSDTLPRASIQDLGVILSGAGFEVYVKGPSLYAFRGLAGRFAPIGVHIALLLIMAGGTLSAAGSFKGMVTVPQGLNFVVGDVLKPLGFLSIPNESFSTEVHVNKFTMEYYDSGVISQYRTDLSLFDLNGKEVLRKTISVNDPLRYGGITIYQTDWDFSALQVKRDNEGPFNLAMAPLELNGDKKLFGTFLPVANPNSPDVKGISLLARDLQSIFIYDQEGKFVGVRRPNSKLPIDVNGTKVEIVDAIGSSGLDMKTDPGVPIVYAGFGFLMLTTCISFLSHAQVWAFQDGTTVVIGGKTNRAKVEFPDEMNFLLDLVPEILESSKSKQPNNI